MEFQHKSVMLSECVEALSVKPDGIYVDGTAGGGGHSYQIAKKLGPDGKLIAIDKDEDAIKVCKERLAEFGERVIFVRDDFKNLEATLDGMNVSRVDGILLDLGVSSYQLDNGERGFSYMKDAPLDMRMDRTAALSAREVINRYSETELAKIFFEYGEEKLARKIAAKIVAERNVSPIETTGRLSEIITECYPKRYNGGHPAKRVFQAVRIEVNGELKGLKEFVERIALRLNAGGRAVILTFHSLEDRAVKQAFKYLELDCICPKEVPICICGKRREIKILTPKPITATSEELRENKRAESAKLRIAERL